MCFSLGLGCKNMSRNLYIFFKRLFELFVMDSNIKCFLVSQMSRNDNFLELQKILHLDKCCILILELDLGDGFYIC